MKQRPNALPDSLAERLSARDRMLAEAHLARAEALIDLLFAVGHGLKRLAAAVVRPYAGQLDEVTRERTRHWPHPQAR